MIFNFGGTKGGSEEYLPLTGGEVSGNGIDFFGVKRKDLAVNVFTKYSTQWGVLGYLGFGEANKPSFIDSTGSGVKELLHTGNMTDHVLPKNGGGTQPTISTNHPQVFSLDNVGENATTLLVFKHKGTIKGRFGTNWAGEPIYQNAEGANYSFIHTGNSAKVHIGSTAPSDTSALWVDTSA